MYRFVIKYLGSNVIQYTVQIMNAIMIENI